MAAKTTNRKNMSKISPTKVNSQKSEKEVFPQDKSYESNNWSYGKNLIPKITRKNQTNNKNSMFQQVNGKTGTNSKPKKLYQATNAKRV